MVTKIATPLIANNKYLYNRLYQLQKSGVDRHMIRPYLDADQYGNIKFQYLDLEGKEIFFLNHERFWERYIRTRYNGMRPLRLDKDGKRRKYYTPKGATVRAYFTALYSYFTNPTTKKYELEKDSKIYIVEGEFKAWALCSIGFPTIGISGIQNATKAIKNDKEATIDADFIDDIKDFIKAYNPTIFVQLQDGDAFDNINRKDRANSFNGSLRNFHFACKRYGIAHQYITSLTHLPKGIDDILQERSQEQTAITAELKDFTEKGQYFKGFNITNQYDVAKLKGIFERSTIKHLHYEKYLSDVTDHLINEIEQHKKIVFVCPTGSGKTDVLSYLIPNRLKQKDSSINCYNAYPTNMANEAKTNEYSDPTKNYNKLELDIISIDQYTDSQVKEYLPNAVASSDVTNFVANSANYILPLIKHDDFLTIDEIHKSITQTDIAPITEINDLLNSDCSTVVMTGTLPKSLEYELKEMGFHIVYGERLINPKIDLNCIEIDNERPNSERNYTYLLGIKSILNQIDINSPKIHFIYLNDIEKLKEAKKHAEMLGFDTDVIYSDETLKQENDTWKAITNSEPISINNKAKIIFSTCVTYESVNIVNNSSEIGSYYVFGELYVENIMQLLARCRLAGYDEPIKAYWVLTSNKNKGYYSKYETYRSNTYKSFNTIKELLALEDGNIIAENRETITSSLALNVAQFTTKDGKFNGLKCAGQYAKKQALKETNKQKFERIASASKHINVNVIECDVSEITNKVFGVKDIDFEKEKEAIKQIITEDRKHKKDTKAFAIEIATDCIKTAMALICDRDNKIRLQPENRVKIEKHLINFNADTDQYKALKEKLKLSDTSKKILRSHLKKIVLRVVTLAEHYQLESCVKLASSSQYKRHLSALNTVIVANGKRNTSIEKVNGIVYDVIKVLATDAQSVGYGSPIIWDNLKLTDDEIVSLLMEQSPSSYKAFETEAKDTIESIRLLKQINNHNSKELLTYSQVKAFARFIKKEINNDFPNAKLNTDNYLSLIKVLFNVEKVKCIKDENGKRVKLYKIEPMTIGNIESEWGLIYNRNNHVTQKTAISSSCL